ARRQLTPSSPPRRWNERTSFAAFLHLLNEGEECHRRSADHSAMRSAGRHHATPRRERDAEVSGMARILSQYSATVVIAALSLLLAGRAAGLAHTAKWKGEKRRSRARDTACRINAAAQASKTGHPPDPTICDA